MRFIPYNKVAYLTILIAILGFSFNNAIAEETVKIVLTGYPLIVYSGQPYSICWEISGGTVVNNTEVHWKLQGEKEFKTSKSFSGEMGKYIDDTLIAAARRNLDHIIFMVYAEVDGIEHISDIQLITLNPRLVGWVEQKQ